MALIITFWGLGDFLLAVYLLWYTLSDGQLWARTARRGALIAHSTTTRRCAACAGTACAARRGLGVTACAGQACGTSCTNAIVARATADAGPQADRSAAYACRWMAQSAVKAGRCKRARGGWGPSAWTAPLARAAC